MSIPPASANDRDALRHWLPVDSPTHALFAYYFLYHPARRAKLTLSHRPDGRVRAALAECTTGMDLFRPLVITLADDEEGLHKVLEAGAPRQRPCLLLGLAGDRPIWQEYFTLSEEKAARLYALRAANFRPVLNVLVTASRTQDDLPRCEIRAAGRTLSYAGLNWRSPSFAEIAVGTDSAARGRHWGTSVVSALCSDLLKEGLMPLYLAEEDNPASSKLAERLGFRDTDRRLLLAAGAWNRARADLSALPANPARPTDRE